MGDELKKQLDLEIEYVAGSGGIFDLAMDGRLLFSKARAGGFPEPAAIVSLIRGARPGGG